MLYTNSMKLAVYITALLQRNIERVKNKASFFLC